MHPLGLPLAARDRRRPRPPADAARRSSRGEPLRAGLAGATKRAAQTRSRSANAHRRTPCALHARPARGVAFSGSRRRDVPRSSAHRIAPAVGAVAATEAAEPPEGAAYVSQARAGPAASSTTARASPCATACRLPAAGAAVSATAAVPAEAAIPAEAAATTASAAPDASAGTAPDDDHCGDDQARLGLRRPESRAHGPAGQGQRQGVAVLSVPRT